MMGRFFRSLYVGRITEYLFCFAIAPEARDRGEICMDFLLGYLSLAQIERPTRQNAKTRWIEVLARLLW